MKKQILGGIATALLPLSGYAGLPLNAGSYQRSYLNATREGGLPQPLGHVSLAALQTALATPAEDELSLVQGRPVRELVVIDAAVPDKSAFYRRLRPGVEAVEIRADQDGLAQLKAVLSRYSDLSAIHIVSHAESGVVLLGNSRVTAEAIRKEVTLFSAINGAIRNGGDLLFYGCELGKGKGGNEFLEIIKGNTLADVAASDNLTGNAEYDGDWNLEVRKGDIEANPLFDSIAMKDFAGVLQFTGTIDFSQYRAGSGAYSNPGYDAQFYESASRNYTLTVNPSNTGSYRWPGGYVVNAYAYSTSITLDFTNGETFTPNSISLYNFSGASRTFYITTSGGGNVSSGAIGNNSWSNNIDISALPDNVTSLTITGSGSFWLGIDDFAVSNLQAPANNDGTLATAGGVTEPVGLPTTVDTVGEAVDVFDFTLTDGGGGDGLAMTVSQIVVNVSGTTSDTIRDQITWRLNGPDVSNVTGTYNAGSDTITFSGLSISVADSGNETYTVNAYYNDNTGLTEDDTFILSVDGDTDLTVGAGGTQMGATAAVTNGAGGTVDVTATGLTFTTQPAGSVSGSALSTQPVVAATDAFGNTDVDFTETITLTEASAGSLANNTQAAVNGVATFTSLSYTATADQQSFTLTANDQDGVGSDLATTDANAVTSDVVATQLVFNTQPAPTSITTGQSTSFTTVPVVQAVDANSTLDSGYSTNVVLSVTDPNDGTVDGTVNSMTGTGDSDGDGTTVTLTPSSGAATFTGLALQYTNGGVSDTIALRATSGGLTAVNSSSITSGTPPTVTDANISISGATGTGGAYVIGDTVTATWNDTAGGDNNSNAISGVTVDFSAFGGGAAVAASNSSDTWTATYTVVSGAIDATNRNVSVTATSGGGSTTTADTTNATVDNAAPTVTDANISISGATGNGGAYILGDTVTATWNNTAGGDNNSDTISGVTVDFSAFGGGAAVAATNSAGTWTATYTISGGSTTGSNLNVSATATDNAGNATTRADTSNATVDNAAPSGHSASLDDGTVNSAEASSISFTFAGAEVGATYDYSISSSGGGAPVTGSGTVTTATDQIAGIDVSGLPDGTLTLSVTLTDGAGNAATAVTDTATLDTAGPGVTISSAASDPANAAFTATVDFGEAVSGFVIGDITAGNATLSGLTDNGGGNYSVTVTPSADGAVTLDVGVGAAQDAAGNDNTAATQFSLTYDGTAPTLDSSTPADNSTSLAYDANLILTFSENVSAGAGSISLYNSGDDSLVESFAIGSVGIAGDTVTVNPSANLTPTQSYYVQIDAGALEDGAGNAYAGINDTTSLNFTVANSLPTAGNDSDTVDEDNSVAVNVLANDSDTESTLNAASVTVVSAPSNGSTSVNTATGVITYTPDADFNGADSFTYTVDDSHGGTSAAATVSITVNAVNDAPVAGNDTATTAEDTPTTIDVAADDTDVDTGDSVDTATITIVTAPSDGTATVNAGQVDYTPDANFNGTDQFTYTIEDQNGATSNVATVVINVTSVNDLPTAGDDTASVDEDGSVVIDVLADDSDVDGTVDATTVMIMTDATNGSTSVDATTGEVTYTPDADYNGADSFTYVVRDNANGTSNEATVSITVNSINDAPVAADNTATLQEDTPHSVNVLGNDSDVDGTLNAASVEIVTAPADGSTSIDTGTGAITYTPTADFNGADSLTYRVQDNDGAWSNVATVTFTVQSVNDAPLANNDSATTDEDTATTITVLGNDSDVDGTLDATTVTVVTGPTSGSTTVNLDGSITYTPDANTSGADSFTYTVNDDGGDTSNTATVSITVNAVNDAPTISGSPASSVIAGQAYSFTPTLGDVEGDTLTVTAANLPAWASLDGSTGAVTGTPVNADSGTYSGIVLTVGDGTDSTALAAFSIDVLRDTDGDGTDDANDTDADGDGMPNDYETDNGFDPLDPTDAGEDTDSDGLSNVGEYTGGSDPLADDQAPTITAPTPYSLNATGLLTELPTLTPPAAVDALDGAVTATRTTSTSLFAPGTHYITWQATDAAGNSAMALQRIDVHPLISLAKDQVRAEGATAQVRFLLNGSSPSYPLSVDYTVGGTADGADHDLTAGTVTFTAGQLEQTVPVNITADASFEGNETVIVTLSGSGNFGARNRHVITIVEDNAAPTLTLSLSQGGREASLLPQDGGDVTFTATVDDPNPADTHSYEWVFPNAALITDTSDSVKVLDPSSLAPGVYDVQLVVRDSGSPILSVAATQSFRIIEAAPTLDGGADSDGDGTDDASEGYGDSDQDGQPDYLDSIPLPNVLNEQSGDDGQFLIEGDPGVKLTLGKHARQQNGGGAGLSDDDLPALDIPADEITNVGGYFDFVIREVPTAGQSVNIVIPQRAAVPQEPVYRKYMNGAWFTFVENANNSLATAPGVQGVCPPPGDAAYGSGLTPGHWCVQLTIEDGGPNDADGAVNGSVEDPGGVGRIGEAEFETSGGGGGAAGPMTLLMLLLGAIWQARGSSRRRLAALLLALALLLPLQGIAAENGTQASEWWRPIYVTGSLGFASTSVSKNDLEEAFADDGTDADVTSVDGNRMGFSLGVGYPLSEGWALEASYLDLGDVDMKFTALSSANDLAEVYPDSGKGLTFSGLYRHPLPHDIKLRARLGLFAWSQEYDTEQGGSTVDSSSESGVNVFWGLGAGYPLSEQWSLSAELQRFEFNDHPTLFLALGVQWRPWP